MTTKPLGRKAYGSIGHLPCSRMGRGDHAVPIGQSDICLKKTRDKHDLVIAQEKLDGSCCAVALVDGVLHAIGRAGWLAVSSPYEQHRMFANWVLANERPFREVLQEGERVVGEWLAQAHGTRYDLIGRQPFVVFDIMRENTRLVYHEFVERVAGWLATPACLAATRSAIPLEAAMGALGRYGHYGAQDYVEGVVYRVERNGKVDFLAKYVRPDKADGIYLSEVSGHPAVWNWKPAAENLDK